MIKNGELIDTQTRDCGDPWDAAHSAHSRADCHNNMSDATQAAGEGSLAVLPSGRSLQAIEQLVKLAASLFDCRCAVLLFNQAGISRAVCGHGLKTHHISYHWSYEGAPYEPSQLFVMTHALGNAIIQTRSPFAGGEPIGCFVRAPVEVSEDHTFTLIVFDSCEKEEPGPEKLRLLDRIIQLLKEEIQEFGPLLADPQAHVSIPRPLQDMKERIDRKPVAAALIDDRMTVIHTNAKLEALLQRPAAQLAGRKLQDLTPRFAGVLRLVFEKALAEKVSSPALEITIEDSQEGGLKTLAVVATPFSPLDTTDYFLLVTVADITQRLARIDHVENDVGLPDARQPMRPEPCAIFLEDTLVQRRTVRSRNSISYLTVRAWRSPVKKYQISALKALKQNIPPSFSDFVAGEIEESITSLLGSAAFQAIVPVPCGHSSSEHCLSLEIARRLAAKLDLPVVQALQARKQEGRSHPKTNVTRPPMQIACDIAGPVLLIDDVATSGAHLQEAVEILKPHCGSVLPVAWIGGETK